MSRIMKSGSFLKRRQLQRCAEFGAPRICLFLGFPEPHDWQCEALPLRVEVLVPHTETKDGC